MIHRLVLCALVAFVFSGCKKPAPVSETPYVAKVGDVRITPDEFAREMAKRGSNFTAEQRETVLQGLIRREALVAKAKAEGFDRDPEMAARVKQLIASAYEEKLRGPENAKTNSTAELQEYYAQHAADFVAPERIRAAMIVWRVPKKATPEKQKEFHARAERVLEQARQLPADVRSFGDLARTNSEDQATRFVGGDLGWMSRGEAEARLGPELAAKVLALKDGEFSDVLSGPEGLYLFRVMQREGSHNKSLEEVKPLLAYRLSREKEAQQQKVLDEQIRAGLEIKIDRSQIDKAAPIKAPVDQTPRSQPE